MRKQKVDCFNIEGDIDLQIIIADLAMDRLKYFENFHSKDFEKHFYEWAEIVIHQISKSNIDYIKHHIDFALDLYQKPLDKKLKNILKKNILQ